MVAIQTLTSTFAEHRAEAPAYLQALVEAHRVPALRDGVVRLWADLRALLAAHITEMRGRRELGAWVDPEAMATLLVAVANGLVLQVTSDPDGPGLEAMAAAVRWAPAGGPPGPVRGWSADRQRGAPERHEPAQLARPAVTFDRLDDRHHGGGVGEADAPQRLRQPRFEPDRVDGAGAADRDVDPGARTAAPGTRGSRAPRPARSAGRGGAPRPGRTRRDRRGGPARRRPGGGPNRTGRARRGPSPRR